MPYRPIQWARRSIEGRQVEADGSRLLNFYAVQLAAPDESKVPVMLYSSPGMRRFLKTQGGRKQGPQAAGIHGLIEINNVVYGQWLFGLTHQSVLFGIRADPANGGAYQINRNYDPFRAAGPDPIYEFPLNRTWSFSPEASEAVAADRPRKIVSDGRRIMWVSPSEVFVFDLKRFSDGELDPFATIAVPVPADLSTLEDLADQDWVDCEWVDGYFLIAARSGQFWHSNVDSIQFDQLDFGEAGSNPDSLVAIEALQRRVYMIGDNSIEAWFNAGLADFAFVRDNSATVNIGCASKDSIAKDQFAIMFLGSDRTVYAMVGGRPMRISSESVEYDTGRSDPSLARGIAYTEEGHRFYSLTLTMDDGTKKNWTWDFMTGVWHERSQTDILCNVVWNKRHNLFGREGAKHIFDSRLDWGVVENDTAAEDDIEIAREAVAPILGANQQRVNVNSFQIDLPRRAGGDAADSILIEWSDDSKETWKGGTATDGSSNAQLCDSGPRFRRNRCGQIREGRHVRITTSAKRRVDILGAYVETDVLPD